METKVEKEENLKRRRSSHSKRLCLYRKTRSPWMKVKKKKSLSCLLEKLKICFTSKVNKPPKKIKMARKKELGLY